MSLTVLFQGDSITDASRVRTPGTDLGKGYVLLSAAMLQHQFPEKGLTIINRGISGNRTKDLLARWDEDCIALKPDVLSLFIGINNTWRRFDKNDPTPADVFETELRALLERTFSGTRVTPGKTILLEPFLLDEPAGTKTHWFEDLTPKQEAVTRAAADFGTLFIPLQSIFNEACVRAPAAHWAPDGVHPSPAGHQLIANAWLETFVPLL
jgi:acyl-CoA thioesterase-1